VGNNTTCNVYQLLLAVNQQAVNGVLYNGNATLQSQAADLLNALNERRRHLASPVAGSPDPATRPDRRSPVALARQTGGRVEVQFRPVRLTGVPCCEEMFYPRRSLCLTSHAPGSNRPSSLPPSRRERRNNLGSPAALGAASPSASGSVASSSGRRAASSVRRCPTSTPSLGSSVCSGGASISDVWEPASGLCLVSSWVAFPTPRPLHRYMGGVPVPLAERDLS
jgi:hypothetical protein